MIIRFSKNNGGGVFTNNTDISRGVSSDPACRHWREFWNSQGAFTGSSSHIGYANGSKVIRGVLIINLVSESEALALLDFFSNVISFVKPFAIYTGYAANADIGKGAGVILEECHIDGEATTEGLIVPLGKGGKYTVTIPYVCFDLVTIEGSFP